LTELYNNLKNYTQLDETIQNITNLYNYTTLQNYTTCLATRFKTQNFTRLYTTIQIKPKHCTQLHKPCFFLLVCTTCTKKALYITIHKFSKFNKTIPQLCKYWQNFTKLVHNSTTLWNTLQHFTNNKNSKNTRLHTKYAKTTKLHEPLQNFTNFTQPHKIYTIWLRNTKHNQTIFILLQTNSTQTLQHITKKTNFNTSTQLNKHLHNLTKL